MNEITRDEFIDAQGAMVDLMDEDRIVWIRGAKAERKAAARAAKRAAGDTSDAAFVRRVMGWTVPTWVAQSK